MFKTEAAFQDHLLVWLISGETKIIQADESFVFVAGSIFLIPRNQLATIVNYPKNGLPHKAVAMHLSTKRLKEFYDNRSVRTEIKLEKIICFHKHSLLESCLNSLIPYMERLSEEQSQIFIGEYKKRIEKTFSKFPAIYSFKRLLLYGKM